MDIILLERVHKLGAIGDVVTVKPGYARNFLLPTGKALRATEANKRKFEAQRADVEARNAANKAAAEAEGEKLAGATFVLIRQAGESGQLYGSVSARDIAAAAAEAGYKVGRNQVVLNTPIKAIGLHAVEVQLHAEVSVTVNANVARTKDEAERQAKGEDIIAAQMDEEREAANAQAAEIFASAKAAAADRGDDDA
jgi:large subunit ribosomal protein L9